MATQLVCDRCDQPIRGAKAGSGVMTLQESGVFSVEMNGVNSVRASGWVNEDELEFDLCDECMTLAEQFVTGESRQVDPINRLREMDEQREEREAQG